MRVAVLPEPSLIVSSASTFHARFIVIRDKSLTRAVLLGIDSVTSDLVSTGPSACASGISETHRIFSSTSNSTPTGNGHSQRVLCSEGWCRWFATHNSASPPTQSCWLSRRVPATERHLNPTLRLSRPAESQERLSVLAMEQRRPVRADRSGLQECRRRTPRGGPRAQEERAGRPAPVPRVTPIVPR